MSEIELITTPELPAKRGVGRPRKADKYAGQIAAAEDRIADQLPRILEDMLALAAGVMVEGFDPASGAKVVYKTPPDFKAGQYLMNRLMGQPGKKAETEINATIHAVTTDELVSADRELTEWRMAQMSKIASMPNALLTLPTLPTPT